MGMLLLAPWLPVSTNADVPPTPVVRLAEPRRAPAETLNIFMREHDFKKPYNVADILQSATEAAIPPSLIVCIEFYESSGGKYFDASTNNPLGWNNGQTTFPSVRAAIHHVSAELGSGRWYAGKTLEEKLHMYNPRPAYSQKILDCMSQFPR